MFSVEGVMGLRSWRYADGRANLRAVVAANSSIADGFASALKPRRTRVSPYPATAIARANRISATAFQLDDTAALKRRADLNRDVVVIDPFGAARVAGCLSKAGDLRWV